LKDKALTGAGGVFHVASVFSMRGMIALPTIRNTAGYDIIATSRDGTRHANVQVKTSAARPDFWPVCQTITAVKTSQNDFYVLLRRTPDSETFEGFMLTGEEMKTELEGYVAHCKATGQQFDKFALCIGIEDEQKAERWRKRWQTWTLEENPAQKAAMNP